MPDCDNLITFCATVALQMLERSGSDFHEFVHWWSTYQILVRT